MKTPVIIPAYNEERCIGRLLNTLPSDLVEPIVAVNGSDDQTAKIAESFGVKVFDLPEQGKLPSVQHVIRFLGKRALEPLLLIDADTVPLFPRLWHNTMLSKLEPQSERPVVIAGPIWFTLNPNKSLPPQDLAARSIYRSIKAVMNIRHSRHTGVDGVQYGPNQGFHFQNQSTLERVVELDHFWPREDLAMTITVVNEGDGIFKPVVHPYTLVKTPDSEAYRPITDRFKYGIFGEKYQRGLKESREAIIDNYLSRAAPGSKLFNDY